MRTSHALAIVLAIFAHGFYGELFLLFLVAAVLVLFVGHMFTIGKRG